MGHEKDRGFIRALGLEDGQVVWEKRFGAQLAFPGLAVDACGIVAAVDDGSVVCLPRPSQRAFQ